MTEVLAPAGSPETVVAAIRAGADAVYFGAASFNARRNAKNFTSHDIAQACSFARVRGVKTYLTLNTLVSDSEMSEALKTAETAAKLGIDALIVQDLGLAALLKKHLPNMLLHASTQMSVHSADALPLLSQLGFTRVVPAREMDKASLIRFCKKAKELGIEVEVFVHGALCMCLSGQCYLSSMLGGRSGNRGLCAQPCRLQFSVPNGMGNDLSLKDMSLVEYIGELSEMGVTSFKIEGRMKRAEYVAAATAVCRAAADGEEISQSTMDVLSGIFSRSGHTDGYYTSRLGRDMFGIRTANDEQMSAKMLNETHELYRNERQSVALFGRFVLKKDTPAMLQIYDKEGHAVSVCGQVPDVAERIEVSSQFLKEKLSKSGGTCYYFESLEVLVDEGLSFSGANIGAMRREAFLKMDNLRSVYDGKYIKDSTVNEYAQGEKIYKKTEPKIVAKFRSVGQIPNNLDGIFAVALPIESDFEKVNLPEEVKLIVDIPRGVLHTSDAVVQKLKKARQNGVSAAFCGNLAAFKWAKEAGLTPIADFGMNVYNTESLNTLEIIGAKAAVASFELSISQINHLSGNIPKGVITYGRLPLMITKNCPGKNGDGCEKCEGKCILTDRKGIEFPVMCNGEFSEIYNSRVLWLFDRKAELKTADFEVLLFTDESKQRCAEVIKASMLGTAPDCEYTRGLYYRQVM